MVGVWYNLDATFITKLLFLIYFRSRQQQPLVLFRLLKSPDRFATSKRKMASGKLGKKAFAFLRGSFLTFFLYSSFERIGQNWSSPVREGPSSVRP